MKKDRKWLWIILGIITAIVLVNVGINFWNRDVVPIKTAQVTKAPIEAIVAASGLLDAPVYDLGSKTGGKISNLRVKEGDYVSKGQLLVEFDNFEQARNDFERTRKLYLQQFASKQSYDAAKTMYDSSRIAAPNDGIVAKINFEEGETVVPGSTAITIVNYDKSWVEAQIDEIDIANVKVGDKVKITSDIYPDKAYEGILYWIAPLAELRRVGGRIKMDEESYVFPCKIKFTVPHSELKANMSLNVEIVTKKNDSAVVVPREAIASKDDSSFVYVIKNNRAIETKIDIGIRSYTSVEALSGISENDIVAVSGISKLKDKGRVKIER